MTKEYFKSSFARNIFYNKYALTQSETWAQKAITIVDNICGTDGGTEHVLLSKDERDFLTEIITDMKFLPGGRYIYYAGRKAKFYNNCYLLRGEEDTREEWAALSQRSISCLMTGGGIGADYSEFRAEGRLLGQTGGQSSGPIPLMKIINEIGRNVMQGGSRRCLNLNEIITTTTGNKRIKNVVVGDMVKTNKGFKPVLAVENTGEKVIYEIQTRAGMICSSAEHRHAVIRNVSPFTIAWVETKDLTENDTLVFYKDKVDIKGGKELEPFSKYTPHHNAKEYTRPTHMSEDLAWFLGALCDGSCPQRGIVFTQREDNIEFLHKTQNIIKGIFGRDTNITKGHSTLECRVHSVQLSEDLKRYRPKNGGRLIHDDIISASFNEKLAFLAGVLDADGSVITTEGEHNKGTFNFTFACSKDGDWIKDLSKLISSLGIPNRVSVQGRGSDKTRKPLWKVRLSDKGFSDNVAELLRPYSIKIRKDYKDVGERKQSAHALVVTRSGHNTPRVMNPMDYRSFSWPEGVLPAKIEKISLGERSETYDIQVEDDECFVANGILTHNSAIYASLNWLHDDAEKFLIAKDWHHMMINPEFSVWDAKQANFNYAAPLDMTNISLNYDDSFLEQLKHGMPKTYLSNVKQALMTGEPGFSFNFGGKQRETLRNACTEVTSEDDSDVLKVGTFH